MVVVLVAQGEAGSGPGNRTAAVEADGDRVTWSYDESYHLTRERRSGANAYDVTYTYDELGNRAAQREGGTITTYSYDVANQLNYEYTPSSRTTYTYDSNGNTTVINAAGLLTTHTWDLENHIIKTELPAGVVNTMTYDGDGVRRRLEDSAGVHNLVWDAKNLLLETGDDGATSVAYTMTLTRRRYGALVSVRRSGSALVHLFDALGSTERLTDNSQITVVSYLYRAFGEQTVLSGASASAMTWVGQLGYYREADPGSYWLRARVYRPSAARFLSCDPLLDQANRYVYVHNRAVVYTDPSGLVQCAYWGPSRRPDPSRPVKAYRAGWQCACENKNGGNWSMACYVGYGPSPEYPTLAAPTHCKCDCSFAPYPGDLEDKWRRQGSCRIHFVVKGHARDFLGSCVPGYSEDTPVPYGPFPPLPDPPGPPVPPPFPCTVEDRVTWPCHYTYLCAPKPYQDPEGSQWVDACQNCCAYAFPASPGEHNQCVDECRDYIPPWANPPIVWPDPTPFL